MNRIPKSFTVGGQEMEVQTVDICEKQLCGEYLPSARCDSNRKLCHKRHTSV